MRGVRTAVRNVGLGFLSGPGGGTKLGTVTVDPEEQSQTRHVEAGEKHGGARTG